MTLGNYRMSVHLCGSFNHPITYFLFLKTAFVADPFFYFSPLVFSCSDTQNIVAPHPQPYFSFTGCTIAMRFQRFGKPYTILETEGPVCQRTYRAHINYVTNKFIVQRFLDIGCN